jgi:hypothetical protein
MLKTILEGPEVQYCEGVDDNLFLLKYFKFECKSCELLCTHTLITECCKTAICLRCSLALADHQAQEKMINCLFCNKNIEKYFMLRDPFHSETRLLAR